MKSKIIFVVYLLFGLMFINGGLNNFFNYIPMLENSPAENIKDLAAMLEISWLMPLVAIVEIIGGLLFIIPKTRVIGILMIIPIMAGIICVHFFVDQSGIPMT